MGFTFVDKVVRGRKTQILCCDSCGVSGGVRRIRCPFGACPPVARCANCRKVYSYQDSKKHHRELRCDFQFTESERRAAKEAYLLSGGGHVRRAARNAGADGVHVLFVNKAGETVGYYMAHETYDGLPALEPACVEDYRALGELSPAPASFY